MNAKITLLLPLFSLLVISCGQNNSSDSNYQNSLRQQFEEYNGTVERVNKIQQDAVAEHQKQEELKRIASRLNGTWFHQRIDPSTYDIINETATFSGDQYMYRAETSGRRA